MAVKTEKVPDEVDMTSFAEVINVYRTALEEIARWEKIKDDLNTLLKDAMGEGSIGLVHGKATLRKSAYKQTRFDAKLFKDEFPELAYKYEITGTYQKLTMIKQADAT